MYLNTTYKAFVAQTAAKLMAEMVGHALASGKINLYFSYNDYEKTYKNLASQASSAAYELADILSERWTSGETVFFDPQDSPTSRIEEGLESIRQILVELAGKI